MTKDQETTVGTLLLEVVCDHKDPDSGNYNGCDKDRCGWCEDAIAILKALGALP